MNVKNGNRRLGRLALDQLGDPQYEHGEIGRRVRRRTVQSTDHGGQKSGSCGQEYGSSLNVNSEKMGSRIFMTDSIMHMIGSSMYQTM